MRGVLHHAIISGSASRGENVHSYTHRALSGRWVRLGIMFEDTFIFKHSQTK